MNNEKKNNKINQAHTLSSRTDCKPYTYPDYKSSRSVVGSTRAWLWQYRATSNCCVVMFDVSGDESCVGL